MKSQRKINEEQVFFALKLRSHYSIQQNCAEKRTWWPQTVCRCGAVRNMPLVWRQTCVSIICVQICDNPCVNVWPRNIEHLLQKQIHSKIFANIKLPYKYTYTAYTHRHLWIQFLFWNKKKQQFCTCRFAFYTVLRQMFHQSERNPLVSLIFR